MRLADAIATLGRPIAYYPQIGRAVGGVGAGILLCQLAYWHGKQRDPDGWIRKSWTELQTETGLSRREIQGARSVLRGLGVIEERLRGVPATTEYRLCLAEIDALLPSTGCTQRGNQMHPTVQLDAPSGASIPETTSETTPEREDGRSLALARAREGFAAFWEVYPRKVGKAAAVKAWVAVAGERPLLATVLEAVERQRRSAAWSEARFIPHPSTWLRRHGWEDETPEEAAARARRERKREVARNPELERIAARERELGLRP